MTTAQKLERIRRWTAPGKSTVTHPKYGTVVVPHISKFSAIENAAEFWRTSPWDIIDASVMAYQDGDGPVRKPKEFSSTVFQK